MLMRFIIVLPLLVVFASGCAVGNQHQYHDVLLGIDSTDSVKVAVGTHDQRELVTSGKKEPNFTGSSRGGWGNPFNVTTASGQALADDMTNTIRSSLDARGYDAVAVALSYSDDSAAVMKRLLEAGPKRALLLTLREWKSDTYTNTSLIYDIGLQVMDETGKVVAQSSIKGRDKLGGSFGNPPAFAKKAVPEAFRQKLEKLLNTPEVAGKLH